MKQQRNLLLRRTLPYAALAATCCILATGTFADERSAKSWKYDARLLRPFWQGVVVEGESVLFVKDPNAEAAQASVLFPVTKILAVKNSAGTMTYEEGRDYQWTPNSREIVLPKGSRIVSKLPGELRRPAGSQKHRLTHRDGDGEIFFAAGLEYAEMQTCITYEHRPAKWPAAPKYDPKVLPRTKDLLQQKRPLTIVVLGDSISTGLNSSKVGNGAPYQPGYPELVRLHVSKTYDTEVRLKNLSVSGTATTWGITQIDRVLAAKPDLVILAFGMNDAAGRTAEEYQANTQKMIELVRDGRPATEFILVASMVGNRDWTTLKSERFPQYRSALIRLRGPAVEVADVTSVWTRILDLKRDWDQTGNGVNHPNDFGHRVYAQVISTLLVPRDAAK